MPAEIRERYEFAPIGLLHTALRWRYEAPRQAGFSEAKARIELYPGRGFEQALEDLRRQSREVLEVLASRPKRREVVSRECRRRLMEQACAISKRSQPA